MSSPRFRPVLVTAVPAVILAVGGLVALTARSRDSGLGNVNGVPVETVIMVTTLSTMVIVGSGLVLLLSRPNTKRSRELLELLPESRIETVRLHDDLLAGIDIVEDQPRGTAANTRVGWFGSVSLEAAGMSIWAGNAPAARMATIPWSRIEKVKVGDWINGESNIQSLMVSVRSKGGELVTLPLIILGAGFGGLWPLGTPQLTDFATNIAIQRSM